MSRIYVGIGGNKGLAGDIFAAAVYLRSVPESQLLREHTSAWNHRHAHEKLRETLTAYQSELVFHVSQISVADLNQVSCYRQLYRSSIEKCIYAVARTAEVSAGRTQIVLTQPEHPAFQHLTCLRENPRESIGGTIASALAFLAFKGRIDDLHLQHPQYHWNKNSAIPTRQHYLALFKHGPALGVHRYRALQRMPVWLFKRLEQKDLAVRPFVKYLINEEPSWWSKVNERPFRDGLLQKQQRSLDQVLAAYLGKPVNSAPPEFLEWCQDVALPVDKKEIP